MANIHTLQACTDSIFLWLLANGLALNPSKSEAIIFVNAHSKPQRDLANNLTSLTIADTKIPVSSSIKNLGVILDNRLSFDNQVAAVCKSCLFHLRAFRKIRSSLKFDTAKSVACSIISTRLDYCNALYAGLSQAKPILLSFKEFRIRQPELLRKRGASRMPSHCWLISTDFRSTAE